MPKQGYKSITVDDYTDSILEEYMETENCRMKSEAIRDLLRDWKRNRPVAALEGQYAPTSFCTLSDSLVDGSRAYGLVMRRKGQAPVLMLSVVEGEPVVEEELFAE